MFFSYICVLHFAIWLLSHPGCTSAEPATQLLGGGAPGLPVLTSALFAYRFVEPSLQTVYNGAILSPLCRLLNSSRECAATDTAQPLNLDWGTMVAIPKAATYKLYPDLQLYPLGAFGTGPIYNLNGITGLILNLQTLAKIWSGRITTWDHPDIQATNLNFTAWSIPANQPIVLVARGDTAGATVVFRNVLAATDPTFSATAPNWGGLVSPILYSSAMALVSYVARNPYAMSYAAVGDAAGLVPTAKLNRSGVVVELNDASVQYAILEKGLSFGNNGDDPAHLTGDLSNALNPLAWPAVGWAYFAVRKDTLRPGATCATRTALVNWWVWFWSSSEVAIIGSDNSLITLPEVVQNQVLARFKQDIYCNGRLVWQEAVVPVIAGYGAESASPVFDQFQQAYALVNESVALNYTTLTSDQTDASALLQAGGFLVSAAPPTSSSTSSVYSLVLGSQAVVAVSTVANLVLDGLTLAKILNGDITTWLHPDILALNHGGLRANGKVLNDTAQRIVLLQGPTAASAALTALLRRYYPAYTGAAVQQSAERFTREALLWTAVVGSPFTFSVTALVGSLPVELLPAAIVSSGVPVAPSLATAKACTAAATFDPASKAVTLSPSGNSSCYPLLLTLYVSLQRQCPTTPAMDRTVTFLRWMFTEDTLTAALDALNLVSLFGVSDAIQASNDEALFQLACQVRPVPTVPTDILPLLLGIIIPIALVVVLGLAACGWWVWRITEHNRMMRKKFSNDNVAESCAEAIARFDLDSVAWLQEVKEPNKIQLAFIAIISLLTEVKPYIPDQLLSRITAKKDDTDDAEEAHSQPASPANRPSVTRSISDSPNRQMSVAYSSSPRAVRRANQSIASSVEGVRQVMAMKDWRRKRCTYMCVRFGSTYANADKRLPEVVHVAGRILDVTKAHGATIDAVGSDFINVHWGVASMSAASAIRAVQAGLEIAALRDTLPE
eukprot:EG_transcript_2264